MRKTELEGAEKKKNKKSLLSKQGDTKSLKEKKRENMGAVGAVEVFCFFVAVSLNVLCYLLHSLPKRWRACGCPQKLLYVSNR